MSKNKKIEITPAKLRAIQKDAVYKTVVLLCACMAEEFDYTKQDLQNFMDRFMRYSAAEKDHLITISQVKVLIEEEMGFYNHAMR